MRTALVRTATVAVGALQHLADMIAVSGPTPGPTMMACLELDQREAVDAVLRLHTALEREDDGYVVARAARQREELAVDVLTLDPDRLRNVALAWDVWAKAVA